MVSAELNAFLVKLERELHDPSVRCNRSRLAVLLHADFVEFGRSGRSYTFSQIVDLLEASAPAAIHAQDFKVCLLHDEVALVTYKSANIDAEGKLERHTLRSSLWLRTAGGWQVIFHQGTPTEAFEQNAVFK